MFTYTSIFLVCLLVAFIARRFYLSLSEKSGSVYNTKLPNAELAHVKRSAKREPKADEGINSAYPTDLRNRGTYAYLGDSQDERVAEEAPHEWPQSVHSVPVDHSKKADNHCSLYQDTIEEPVSVEQPKAAWPQREDKLETGGKAYKVTRKVAADNVNLDTDAKPWGW